MMTNLVNADCKLNDQTLQQQICQQAKLAQKKMSALPAASPLLSRHHDKFGEC